MPAALRWLLRLLPLNPIAVRLVQGGSRRMRHNLIRSAYLAVLIAALLILLLPQSGQLSYQKVALNGAQAFEIVAYLQVALICVLAPVFMAGAIAQESNPRTWEVLLTTPLTAMQMVLGHLFGRLFFVLALLFASLPLFALTQYFGGVPGRSILQSYAVAAGAALLVGAIAIALAVNRLAGRRAVFAFYVSVVTYLSVTIAVDSYLNPAGGVTPVTALNPFLALRAVLNPTGHPGPDTVQLAAMSAPARLWFGDPVLSWCLLSFGLSAALVLASAFTVRAIGAGAGGVPWYRKVFGLGAQGARSRPPRSVWTNPIAWREAAARQATLPKLLLRWAFIGSGGLWGLGILLAYHAGRLDHHSFRFVLLMTGFTEVLVIVLVAINTSATAISREREDGTLDLLLTTPITPGEYLGGKIRGLISYLAPLLAVPMGTVALAGLYTLAGGLERAGGVLVPEVFGTERVDIPVVLPEAAVVFPVVTVAFVAFCVVVGLWRSLHSRGTIGSVIGTVGVVALIGGIAGLCAWQSGTVMAVVGPALSAATPLTALLSSIEPGRAFAESVESAEDFRTARIALIIGAFLAAGAYALIVAGTRTTMVRGFDRAVRELAGGR